MSYLVNSGSLLVFEGSLAVVTLPTYDDWYLPSAQEGLAMYTNLKAEGIGGFTNSFYWTSTESEAPYNPVTAADAINMSFGTITSGANKISTRAVRATRNFEAGVGAYSLGDNGPAGGWIFYIDGGTYYECAPADSPTNIVWSNVEIELGTTSDAIGTGLANSELIIGQPGHTTSAAQYCLDYSISA